MRNPNTTVLEFLRASQRLSRDQVAAFTSWSVFSAIVEKTRRIDRRQRRLSAVRIRVAEVASRQRAAVRNADALGQRADTMPTRSGSPCDHLDRHRPRVLYLALGETDDWAHDGRYDRVLETYTRTDQYLKQLWDWLQAQPEYRGSHHILITTDHGRGRTPADWRDHGEKVAGAGETWMAFVSPSWPRRGEWREHDPPITTSQAAATLIAWMGGDWKTVRRRAAPIRP